MDVPATITGFLSMPPYGSSLAPVHLGATCPKYSASGIACTNGLRVGLTAACGTVYLRNWPRMVILKKYFSIRLSCGPTNTRQAPKKNVRPNARAFAGWIDHQDSRVGRGFGSAGAMEVDRLTDARRDPSVRVDRIAHNADRGRGQGLRCRCADRNNYPLPGLLRQFLPAATTQHRDISTSISTNIAISSNGSSLREFSLHRPRYAPQIRAKLASTSRSPRYGRPSPTGS